MKKNPSVEEVSKDDVEKAARIIWQTLVDKKIELAAALGACTYILRYWEQKGYEVILAPEKLPSDMEIN